jgi:hypothetical protein
MTRPRMAMFLMFLVAGVVVIALIVRGGFRREYVPSAGSLLNLRASEQGSTIIVSGGLLASGAKITRLTTSRYGDVILIRVYAAAIEADDDPRTTHGTFAVRISREPTIRAIKVGDGDRMLTVGNLYGAPIRLPRSGRDDTANEVVWTRP